MYHHRSVISESGNICGEHVPVSNGVEVELAGEDHRVAVTPDSVSAPKQANLGPSFQGLFSRNDCGITTHPTSTDRLG